MKKILLLLGIIGLTITGLSAYASSYDYIGAPNAGNRNFAPLMKQQFEKEETMNFIQDPDEYKVKRERKDAYLDYKEGKTTEIPEFLKPKIDVQTTRLQPNNSMQFTTDENGQIKIQSIK